MSQKFWDQAHKMALIFLYISDFFHIFRTKFYIFYKYISIKLFKKYLDKNNL